ncbi:MAG: Stk1 family PASTA domain-containing Ser/Thr kinase [Clostridia bacterium]|nr:Stk1 family PASTA domain-containing Ser/Thr kinase [Clostridia bacterium]
MQNYVGKRLDGRYEIREIIGVGGMAVVYKAYDNIDDRIVAVKILKEEFLANEEFRRRFKNESKAIAVLSHMNIVKVYDVSYGDRLQYIVMEYVEGITLKEYIQQQGFVNHREAVFFIMQVLRALQHAHDKGIVHRDIKPQNILLLENGVIKVTDFGIARFFASETRTMTDSAIGSVHYISPEQARGDITNDKADIYSVGVMLYEMLTGRVPFESDNTVSVAIMQLQKDPVMPRMINPQIPIGIEQIIIKAMQKNPNDRYQSAAEMLLDLEEFRRNPSIQFDYSYSNNDKTKYIPNVTNNVTAYEVDSDDGDYDDEPIEKNKTIPILIGVIIALVLGLGVMAVGIFGFGWFSGKEKVPDFIGQEYSEDFKTKYSQFTFKITEKTDLSSKPNTIISQTPAAGEKIDPGKQVIEIVIAVGKDFVTIPSDLEGKDYVTVKNALAALDLLTVDREVEYTKDYEEKGIEAGTVIDITPAPGNKVYAGSTVTIRYLSYNSNNVEVIPVPDVTGLPKADATRVLEASGFVVKIEHDYDDTIKSDYVIKSSVSKDTKIPKGSEIVLTISLGIKVEQSTYINITLPTLGEYGTITASLDGVNILTVDRYYLDGSSYSFAINGHKAASNLKVFVNNKLVYKCDIDFTKSPCEISNISTFEYIDDSTSESTTTEPMLIMPDVLGDTPEDARQKLIAAGFDESKISIVEEGMIVVKQFPVSGHQHPDNVNITLTLGEMN